VSFDLSVIPNKNIVLAVTGGIAAFGDMIVMFSFIIIQFIVLRKYFKNPE